MFIKKVIGKLQRFESIGIRQNAVTLNLQHHQQIKKCTTSSGSMGAVIQLYPACSYIRC